MAVTQQVQWYTGYVTIGGVVIPCFPPCTFNAPSGWIVPPLIGNYWQVNYGDGFIQPSVDIVFAVRDTSGEVLSSAFLGHWLTRTTDTAHDTANTTLSYWDGYRGWTANYAKADSFTMGASKGEIIRFTGRFLLSAQVGADIAAITTAPGSFSGFSAGPNYLNFDAVSFDSNLSTHMWRFDFSFSNNCSPDMSLNGLRTPANVNAGMMTVGLQGVVQARDDANIPGGLDSDQIPAIHNPGGVFQLVPASMTISGSASKTCTFTFSAPLNNDPYTRMIQPPRGMRNYSFTSLGSIGQIGSGTLGGVGSPMYAAVTGF
jgi:hypothetical protein